MENGANANKQEKREEGNGIGVEDEKVTEPCPGGTEMNPSLTITIGSSNDTGLDEAPPSFDEFVKTNLNEDNNSELVDDDKEWKIDNAQMRVSAEESLQLEKELTQEMSYQRRMSRAQDVTLLQFVQIMEQQQQQQQIDSMSMVLEEPGNMQEAEGDEEGEKDDADKETEKKLDNKKHGKKRQSATPVITEIDSDSELSQLVYYICTICIMWMCCCNISFLFCFKKINILYKSDGGQYLNAKDDDKTNLSNKSENDLTKHEDIPSNVKDMLDGRTTLDIQGVALDQLPKDSLILLLEKLNTQWKQSQQGKVTTAPQTGTTPRPQSVTFQDNESEELPLIVNTTNDNTFPDPNVRQSVGSQKSVLQQHNPSEISDNRGPRCHGATCCPNQHCAIL
ncbi:hypothetical protein RFI_18504 [Reticulomyxa filosa]|uniref:Uncharacterized protein n=1 Tax=Reticulomyxa filosa TaxID=46433 RepID=X6MYP2_RETFI|nr:hypothetical protein RFI_18504 [Reticulomyxa filosa]|eukprot:ETO18753.1 hypothetical protein RFI_18504 [Reticulomyxa filosa]